MGLTGLEDFRWVNLLALSGVHSERARVLIIFGKVRSAKVVTEINTNQFLIASMASHHTQSGVTTQKSNQLPE
jgi:hypothetical protein